MGQLVVCVPGVRGFNKDRLRTVTRVARSLADRLNMPLRGVYGQDDLYDISVYYVNDEGRREYVYSDWDPRRDEEAVRLAMLSLTPTLSSMLAMAEVIEVRG